MPPFHKLGCLGRQLAWWSRNFVLLNRSRPLSSISCPGGWRTLPTLPPPPCPESAPYLGRSPPAGAAPHLNPRLWSGDPAFFLPTTSQTGGPNAAQQTCRFSSSKLSLTLRLGRGERLQKPQETGPDCSNISAHLQHALLTQVCHTHPVGFGVQKETISISLFPCGSPPTTRSFAASSPRDRRHSRLSSTVYGPHTGHFSVQCFTLYSPEQGHQGLSFLVEVVASPRPSRRPNTGMSSTSQYSASSIAFFSWMGASTRCIALGSTHSSVRLHTSVWPKPPSLWRGSPESSKQHLEVFCATAGTFLPPTKGSNRGTTSVRPGARLFQQLLSWTKEGRWSMIHSVPALSEPLPLQSSRCWRWRLLCPRFKWKTGSSLSTRRMPIFTFRLSGGTGNSFGLLLEGRLTSTRFFPLAWSWRRGCSQNAWMLLWPFWGSRAFVYSTTWMIGSFWPTPGS